MRGPMNARLMDCDSCGHGFPLARERRRADSLALDTRLADDRPPLVDLGLVEGGERLRRLLRARKDVLAEIGEALAHGGLVQRLDDDRVEPCHDLLWRALGRPAGLPERKGEARAAG